MMLLNDRELACSANEIRAAAPETWVPIKFETAELLRRCDGRLVSKVYNYDGWDGEPRLYAPRWAADAAYPVVHGGVPYRGAFIKLIRRACKQHNVRDAILAALEARGDFIVQLAVMQAKKE